MKPSLLVTSNIPSPYFLNYLSFLSDDFEIDVVFELKSASDRVKNWASDYKNSKDLHIHFVRSFRVTAETAISFGFAKFVKHKEYDRIIVANPTTPSGIIFLTYLKKHKIPYCLQSEGGFPGSGQGLKEKIKKRIMSGAVFYLTGMGGNRDYFLQYGASLETLKPYNFTSMFEHDVVQRRKSNYNKLDIRKNMQMPLDKHIVISVGRVLPVKGYDFLIDIISELDETKFEFYIIGGCPTKKMLKQMKNLNVNNLHFVDFITQKELSDYYKAADIFVFTTRGDTWGLVINEAMSYGLPVVTSNMAVASQYLIENDVNGYICDFNSKDQFKSHIVYLSKNQKSRQRIMQNNFIKIENYTLEKMAKQISYYLKEEWI